MSSSRILIVVVLWVAVVIKCIFSFHSYVDVGPRSVCVPGGGFSRFWFLLGQLHRIPVEAESQYYCNSAGCLVVVATLNQYTMEEISCIAITIQQEWKKGRIHRYDVVGIFVDSLLYQTEPTVAARHPRYHTTTTTTAGDPFLCFGGNKEKKRVFPLQNTLSQINVITSTAQKNDDNDKINTAGFLKPIVRSPQNLEELRDMLIQTTWIPFIIGNGFSYHNHLDGIFTKLSHPKCETRTTLPFPDDISLILDMIGNAFNVNLEYEKVQQYWNAGYAHGI